MICRNDRCACGRRECPTPDECDDAPYTPEDALEMAVGLLCIFTALACLAAAFF